MTRMISAGILLLASLCAVAEKHQAYFGDLHVHTRYSIDAYTFGNRTTPDAAYEFAKGGVVTHPEGFAVQLDRPLDFYAVTDHAEYLGAMTKIDDPQHPLYARARELGILDASTVAARGVGHPLLSPFVAEHSNLADRRSAWSDIVAAADRHYEPGRLTTFVAYEFTSFAPDGGNLHRNVIFASSDVPQDIFGRLESFNPEDLWRWMDEQRAQGMEVLAIPHNSNGSNGHMFANTQWDGSPIDAQYAELRLRNEPLVEVTQVKGTSDTHPFLSPNDEWADFEIFPWMVARWQKSGPSGSYVRDAYLNGLRMESEAGFNPYQFGLVGASDTHNTGSRFDEENFVGKVGVFDALAQRRGSVPVEVEGAVPAYRHVFRTNYSAAGLSGVWAAENTREAIYAAFRRKETFATSGPRMRIRLAAAPRLPNQFIGSDWQGKRVTAQGGRLRATQDSPQFAVWATRDALGAPLQRLQMIKGWYAQGKKHEQVFDVACADGGEVDAQTHRCPDNGAQVDLTDCSISSDKGAAVLSAIWEDPEFDAGDKAVYYARVLENPTCRWSTWDAVRAGVAPRNGYNTTLQERAWTSPIWVN